VPSRPRETAREFVQSFQQGEEKGFNFFFREYYASLTYFSYQIIKDKREAEEIAGEALMKLWERHANFDNITSAKSFLYTTTRNASLNWIRQKKKNNQRAKEFAYLNDVIENPITNQIVEVETFREIFLTLETLPPKCRQIFRMHYLEGKDYNQIAKELNLSIKTIYSQNARASLLIRQRIVIALSMIVFVGKFI
jgi:RNA polymerase sigma-70 factor (ECF subfamily)